MAVTHRKRMFAREFARNGDRQQACQAAGFAMGDWHRTATRLLADSEVLGLIEKFQEQQIAKFDAAKITDEYVLAGISDLIDRVQTNGLSAWSAQAEAKLWEMLGRYRKLFTEHDYDELDVTSIIERGRLRLSGNTSIVVNNTIVHQHETPPQLPAEEVIDSEPLPELAEAVSELAEAHELTSDGSSAPLERPATPMETGADGVFREIGHNSTFGSQQWLG